MSVISHNRILFADSFSIDATARLRTSNLYSVFNSKFLYDKQPLLWDEQVTGSGSTASAYSANESCVKLIVGTISGNSVIRQTRFCFNHQPGCSQIILLGAVIGAGKNNVRKRWGYFDNDNGIFFEQSGTNLKTVIRSKVSGVVTETAINQINWNLDKMDGSGDSGTNIDLSKVQTFVIDFSWAGAGRVRMGFVMNGVPVYCHQFVHANILSAVYMSTPNLPIRFEIENTGTSASATELKQLACQVMTEGGFNQNTMTRSVDVGINSKSIGTTLKPIISVKLKDFHKSAIVIPSKISILASATKNFRYAICINPTIDGGAAASWTDVPDSAIRYDKARTGNITNEGIVINSGYTAANITPLTINFDSDYIFGASIDGVPDEVVIAAHTTGGSDAFLASVGWKEYL